MQSDAVRLFCPNPLCQAPNPESHKFCHQCRTPIPKRYLWATGKGMESLQSGSFLGGRYLLKQDRIVLDTHPGLPPELPEELSSSVETYLKLSIFQPHTPQVFGVVRVEQKRATSEILLLEQAPIYPDGIGNSLTPALEGRLMPALEDVWSKSSRLRQLNWLWQIAQLWQPFSLEGAASTLLCPDFLRVEGSLVRLLELQADGRKAPSLVNLAQLWQQWQSTAQIEIAGFLEKICQQMLEGQIRNAEQLGMVLDRALTICGQEQSYQIQIATCTDQGPSRQRNEDACYPPSGSVLGVSLSGGNEFNPSSDLAETSASLVVVCDGIGGHEGGDVASNLAIATIQQKLQRLSAHPTTLDPVALMSQLEQAALSANDVISQRNDSEQRQERQRMGTTLVMSLLHHHELYITHVGDSRAYRISRTGCHQVTLDDDLASREVRLGYALYREALQQPGSGSLIQALGMNASSLLHPTVQRFILDEDCLFLLCSDGLSDNDRVEQHWQTELVPVLDGRVDLATAIQRLVAIANRENGHDNVTVGLVYCQTSQGNSAPLEPLDAALAVPTPTLEGQVPAGDQAELSPFSSQTLKPEISPVRRSANPLSFVLSLAGIIALASLVAALLIPVLRSRMNPSADVSPSPLVVKSPTPIPTPPPPPPSPPPLSVGSLVQVSLLLPGGNQPLPITLLPQPPTPDVTQGIVATGSIPIGSVLQVSSRQFVPNQGNWLRLKVCSVPTQAGVTSQSVQPGQSGWVEEATISPLVTQELSLTPTQLGVCATSPPSQASTTP